MWKTYTYVKNLQVKKKFVCLLYFSFEVNFYESFFFPQNKNLKGKVKYTNDSLIFQKHIYMWLGETFSVSYLWNMQVFLEILCLGTAN